MHPAFDWMWNNLITTVFVFFAVLVTIFNSLPTIYNPYQADREAGTVGAISVNVDGQVKQAKKDYSVQILVLGDIGRSPRMLYHALSFAHNGGKVNIIGYKESDIPQEIWSNERITVTPLTNVSFLSTSNIFLFLLFGPLKVALQTWFLFYTLTYTVKPARWVLIQNPPAIPTLAVASFVAHWRNEQIAIDWHNFGYSILALKLGKSHPLVFFAKLYERLFAKVAEKHMAVSDAMTKVLKSQFGVIATTVHDRPAAKFQPLHSKEKVAFLKDLSETIPELGQGANDLAHGRRKLVVSSTSWTADEDFSILLNALVGYAEASRTAPNLPRVTVIVTGKGPLKQHYLKRIENLKGENKLLNVDILTAWFSPEEYPKILASADLGVSLHTSSSGVDLPMKVVDMFGAGIPVVGWSKYESWPELVKENINGKGFDSAEQLKDLLVQLLGEKPDQLAKLKEGALKESKYKWNDEWDATAARLFLFKK